VNLRRGIGVILRELRVQHEIAAAERAVEQAIVALQRRHGGH
jgi:hypothetical protein